MNRIALALGIGLTGIALVAGCTDDEGEDDGLTTDTDGTTVATATVDTTPAETETPMAATPDTTGTPSTGTQGADTPDEITLTVVDGELQDDTGMTVDDQEISTGTTVTFENDGESAIQLSTEDGAIDEEIEPGDSYEHTFDEAGTWTILVDGTEAGIITVTDEE